MALSRRCWPFYGVGSMGGRLSHVARDSAVKISVLLDAPTTRRIQLVQSLNESVCRSLSRYDHELIGTSGSATLHGAGQGAGLKGAI